MCIAGFLANHVLHSHKHLMMLGQTRSAHKPKLVASGTSDGIASVKSVRWLVDAVNRQLLKLQQVNNGSRSHCQDDVCELPKQQDVPDVQALQSIECVAATHFWTEREHIIELLEHVVQSLEA